MGEWENAMSGFRFEELARMAAMLLGEKESLGGTWWYQLVHDHPWRMHSLFETETEAGKNSLAEAASVLSRPEYAKKGLELKRLEGLTLTDEETIVLGYYYLTFKEKHGL